MGMTRNELRILQHLKQHPGENHFGLSIIRATKLVSGTVYAALGRMESEGLVASCLEDIDPHTAGRPARRFFSITAFGVKAVETELRALGLPMGIGQVHA